MRARQLWVLVFMSCAGTRNFQPIGHIEAQGEGGQAAVAYHMSVEDGPEGDVKVWSTGAVRSKDGKHTLVRITLDLTNSGIFPLTLDLAATRLEALVLDNIETNSIHATNGVLTIIEPGKSATVELEFMLPKVIAPGDITRFNLHWAVRAGAQAFARTTPFHPATEEEPDPYFRRVAEWY